jgi:2-phospho-L-lactate guanylyltransferase
MQALIPVKDLNSSKSRLAHALPDHGRQSLMSALLADLLDILQASRDVSAIAVITRCPQAAQLARAHGADVLSLVEDTSLNSGVTAAVGIVTARGANEVMILHGDLPLAEPEDIDSVIRQHRESTATVTLVPDNQQNGTNALLLTPPVAMAFCYGAHSYRQHLAQCLAQHMAVQTVNNEHLGCDLDIWQDFDPLLSLRDTGHHPRLACWLAQYNELFDWPLAANH